MKKIALVLAIAILAVSVLFAEESRTLNEKNQLSIGANFGSDTGFAFRYGLGDIDLAGNVGFDFFEGDFAFSGDVMANVAVYRLDFGKNAVFPITVGAGARTGFWSGDDDGMRIALFAPVGIEYSLEDACDTPFSFYFRLGPQLWLMKETKLDVDFNLYAALGCYWTF